MMANTRPLLESNSKVGIYRGFAMLSPTGAALHV